jgi:hypothetical protein
MYATPNGKPSPHEASACHQQALSTRLLPLIEDVDRMKYVRLVCVHHSIVLPLDGAHEWNKKKRVIHMETKS